MGKQGKGNSNWAQEILDNFDVSPVDIHKTYCDYNRKLKINGEGSEAFTLMDMSLDPHVKDNALLFFALLGLELSQDLGGIKVE